ncbi:MAG: response regulator transcription factor [Cyanobacteria bacterium SZAS LIN-2]|nr:response regulator transcription factor [Cyanobacteria bacterium SZAS LIN-3]MBS1999381.1 response regulator transcription factor [Cyanobacteria bacterium SZAS LIN-2]MBS2010270.1 response regulator transcription factor [Cyanobacteria bacterium SZAS TMP-1]
MDGNEAISLLKNYPFDLIILDWELPGCHGIEVLKAFRRSGGKTPVLFLTGRDSVDNKVQGLEFGADDYLTKPFHGRELVARINALLRRPVPLLESNPRVGDFEFDRKRCILLVDGQEVKLMPKEAALVEFLITHSEQLFPVNVLLDRVWPSDSDSTRDALVSCIKRLRRKLADVGASAAIHNEHGLGFGLFPGRRDG